MSPWEAAPIAQHHLRDIVATGRRPDIQGLRAVAVAMVVAFHAGLPLPGGFVGVDVFFVISGFVITAMLRREWDATSKIRVADFYLRRFKRLTPALALMVAVTVAVSALVLSPSGSQQTVGTTAIGAMLMGANFAIARTTGGYFDAPAHVNPLLNTWSLSVEEQFYLAFPLLLAIGWRFGEKVGAPKLTPFLLIGLMATTSLMLANFGSTANSHPEYSWFAGFYSPFTRVWELSAGGMLSLVGPRFKISSRHLASTFGIVGAAALFVSTRLISSETPYPGTWTLLPVSGTLLLIFSGFRESNPVSRCLAAGPLVKIGEWSYSIYLWHWPMIVFAGILWPGSPRLLVLAIALSVGIALVSHYWIEQPIRQSDSWGRAEAVRFLPAMIGIPLFLGGGLKAAADSWFWNESLRSNMTAIQSHPTGWGNPLCVSRIPVGKRDVKVCQWNSTAIGMPVYLIGDSNAMHFSEALIEAGKILQRPVTALGSDGCPFIDVHIKRRSDPSLLRQCREDYVALMAWIQRQSRGAVLISSVDRYWWDPEYLVSDNATFTKSDYRLNSKTLNSGLMKTVSDLQKAGHKVVLIQTIPHFIAEPYKLKSVSCSGWSVLTGSCRRPLSTMPREFADNWQIVSRSGYLAVAEASGVGVLDLREFFCPNGLCSTRHSDGTDLYMLDGYHLNKFGSALLQEEFVKRLASLE